MSTSVSRAVPAKKDDQKLKPTGTKKKLRIRTEVDLKADPKKNLRGMKVFKNPLRQIPSRENLVPLNIKPKKTPPEDEEDNEEEEEVEEDEQKGTEKSVVKSKVKSKGKAKPKLKSVGDSTKVKKIAKRAVSSKSATAKEATVKSAVAKKPATRASATKTPIVKTPAVKVSETNLTVLKKKKKKTTKRKLVPKNAAPASPGSRLKARPPQNRNTVPQLAVNSRRVLDSVGTQLPTYLPSSMKRLPSANDATRKKKLPVVLSRINELTN